MFNDGVKDGVYYYPQIELEKNIYDEQETKKYGLPVLLVSKVVLSMAQESQDVSVIKGKATFTIPYKDMKNKGIKFEVQDFQELRKGIIRYKDTYYEIDNVEPHAFVEQVFLLYDFQCTEIVDMSDIELDVSTNDEETVKMEVEDYEDYP